MAAAALLLLCATSAAAQSPSRTSKGVLKPGSVVAARFIETDREPRAPYHCFELDVDKGTSVTVDVSSKAMRMDFYVGGGEACSEEFTVVHKNGTAGVGGDQEFSFVSGGGRYLVRTTAIWGVGIFAGSQGMGPYTIKIIQNATPKGKVLPPGVVPAKPREGTASTVNGGEAREAGSAFADCTGCPQMTVLPGGSFVMGSPPDELGRDGIEGPRHQVTFARPFAMGTYEVTFAEYDLCVAAGACGASPPDQGWGRDRRPVINVNFAQAVNYANWLSTKTGKLYFIPSEAEWEYAARAGSDTAWNTGDAIITDDANILNQFKKTVNVGGYPANAFGLYDMHGNVWEWTLDCLDSGYVGAPTNGAAASGGDCNVGAIHRGGGFDSEPRHARSAVRGAASRVVRVPSLGFRVARAL